MPSRQRLQQQGGISGSTFKIIAMISMLIDHTGIIILSRLRGMSYVAWMDDLYRVARGVGRLAFPIFCFLLVEGMLHTSNRKKYAGRLFLFALISEIPYDLMMRDAWIVTDTQNVFFTLLFGLMVLIIWEWMKEHDIRLPWIERDSMQDRWSQYALQLFVLGIFMVIARWMHTDYSWKGVLAIGAMYFIRQQKGLFTIGGEKNNMSWAMSAGCMTLLILKPNEIYAFIDILLVRLYNGKRGLGLRYVFYLFYPVHIAVVYFVGMKLGIV